MSDGPAVQVQRCSTQWTATPGRTATRRVRVTSLGCVAQTLLVLTIGNRVWIKAWHSLHQIPATQGVWQRFDELLGVVCVKSPGVD